MPYAKYIALTADCIPSSAAICSKVISHSSRQFSAEDNMQPAGISDRIIPFPRSSVRSTENGPSHQVAFIVRLPRAEMAAYYPVL